LLLLLVYDPHATRLLADKSVRPTYYGFD